MADSIFLVMDALSTAIRSPQRILNRIERMVGGKERIGVLLNRTSEQHFIAPEQIEAALGYPIHHAFPNDYGTASAALNAGVPVSFDNNSKLGTEFVRFTRALIGAPDRRRCPRGIDDAASMVASRLAEI